VNQKITYLREIPENLAGLRLDQALALIFPEFSRSRLKNWLTTGNLRVDGKDMRPRDKVNGTERIFIEAELEAQEEWLAEPIALNIIHEDDDILIVNKPAGLVVHPGTGHKQGTLVNALLHHVPDLATLPRAGLIHRLDKDTSGLLLIAKNLISHHFLSKQLQKRKIHREYRAVVFGMMTAGGTINTQMGRHPHQRQRMAVVNEGKEAVTHYRVIERFTHYTYVKVILETGRTHQIRVHMAHIHYPIIGDPVYGGRLRIPPKASEELKNSLRNFKRQALHAFRLELTHPKTREICQFETDIPEDMRILLSTLKIHG
jgi:23S rRNA pseudouridine1911/1915/1917 synthase